MIFKKEGIHFPITYILDFQRSFGDFIREKKKNKSILFYIL